MPWQPPYLSIRMHDFRDHCYRQSVPLLLFVIILRTIYIYILYITVKHYLGTVRLLQPKTKQSSILCQHGEYRLLAPNCPQPRFRARDLHGLLPSYDYNIHVEILLPAKLSSYFIKLRTMFAISRLQHV